MMNWILGGIILVVIAFVMFPIFEIKPCIGACGSLMDWFFSILLLIMGVMMIFLNPRRI